MEACYFWIFAFTVQDGIPRSSNGSPLPNALLFIPLTIPPSVPVVVPPPNANPPATPAQPAAKSAPPPPQRGLVPIQAKDANAQHIHFIQSGVFASGADANQFLSTALGSELFAKCANCALYRLE